MVLGLSCGNAGGSAEILLIAALQHAGDEVALVRLDEVDLGAHGDWMWERLMEADALIVSAPIYTRTVPGKLRELGDRLLGPNADVAFVDELLKLERAGTPAPVPFRIDERVLKPRVGGFIAVGGSLAEHWRTLALPLMHTVSFSMQIAIADQVQFGGAGLPQSIVLDAEALDRAALLGRNVASQIGRAFDDVEYLGPPGLCPMCHLSVVAFTEDEVECATCGARGTIGPDGKVAFIPEHSVITVAEKRAHFFEVQDVAREQGPRRGEIESLLAPYASFDRVIRPS
jgi:multimeric flavodoxin WrbA